MPADMVEPLKVSGVLAASTRRANGKDVTGGELHLTQVLVQEVLM